MKRETGLHPRLTPGMAGEITMTAELDYNLVVYVPSGPEGARETYNECLLAGVHVHALYRGKLVHGNAITVEVTERLNRERELPRFAVVVREVTTERTVLLTEQALVDLIDAYESDDRQKQDFVSDFLDDDGDDSSGVA